MKISLQAVVQSLNLLGLMAITLFEVFRPDTVGAAMNLSLVVLIGSVLLMLSVRKNPPSATEG